MAMCPNGHANPDGQRFCGECGERIVPLEPATPEGATTPDPEAPDSATRPAAPDEHASEESQAPERARVNRRPFWITVGAILGLVAFIAVISGVGRSGDTSNEQARDCPEGMYYDDDLESCTPTEDAFEATESEPTIPPITAPRFTTTTTTLPCPPGQHRPFLSGECVPIPPPPSVTYDLTGQGTVSVTMQNASGGTEQFETRLPFHLDLGPAGVFGGGVSGFVYISAQLQSSGTVTCEIKKGDQVIQTATSSGQYVIATCSGSV